MLVHRRTQTVSWVLTHIVNLLKKRSAIETTSLVHIRHAVRGDQTYLLDAFSYEAIRIQGYDQ